MDRRMFGQLEAERPFQHLRPTAHLARAWEQRGADTRRWAFYNIGAMMRPIDTGQLHGPVQWLEPAPAPTPAAGGHERLRLFAPVDVMPGQLAL